jgi:hypothetical protein
VTVPVEAEAWHDDRTRVRKDDGRRRSGIGRWPVGEMRSAVDESAMLDIAAMYERMAKRAAEREAKNKARGQNRDPTA